MKTVGVVTVARSDYGLYVPVLRRLQGHPRLRLQLWVAGSHLAAEYGRTVEDIERDGFEIAERLPTLLADDTPEAVGGSMGLGVLTFARCFAQRRPDVLLVLGDRFEMLSPVVAALPQKIAVAHIHGGEVTMGAIDESIRHAITKMSHLHFVATEAYAQRVIQMGEEPWRVTVTGAPGLDRLRDVPSLPDEALERQFQLDVRRPFLLATYHPATLTYEQTPAHIAEVLAALQAAGLPVIITYPGADLGSRRIIEAIEAWAGRSARVRVARHLGTAVYASLMARAAAMVGNSSSGLIEAPMFRLPAVNVGPRQAGRVRARNVIDVECRREEILAGIQRATSAEFRASLADLSNPYGDGAAAPRIVECLDALVLDDRLFTKRFHDVPVAAEAASTALVIR